MMKLSTKSRYALRAVTELALRGAWPGSENGARVVSLGLVAERQGIDVQYLRHIFSRLRQKGIVKSVQGRSGGYTLAKAPERINAFQVITAMGEKLGPVECVQKPGSCKRLKECPTHPLWCRLAEQFEEVLTATTVALLADRCPRRGKESLPRGYTFDI
jgi:Rrf2 family protein